MMRGNMTGVERRHKLLMGVYIFGLGVAMAAAWFPSFLCRAGSAVLLVGLMHMIWQRRSALRGGLDDQIKLCQSVVYYAPFLAGANLIWMGLPVPADAMAKAWSDCAFLGGSVLLLGIAYIYNLRMMERRIEAGSFH